MNPLKLSTHWLVLIALFVGGGLGLLIQRTDAGPALPVGVEQLEGNLRVSDTGGVAGVQVGDTVLGLEDTQVSTLAAYQETLAGHSPGRVLNLILQRGETESFSVPVKVLMSPGSTRAGWIAPLDFIANLFLRLLKMLIVPLILTSIISGVVSVGDPAALGRIGFKTMAYYFVTSLLAIIVGLAIVNIFQPGIGAKLDLKAAVAEGDLGQGGLLGIFLRMVPENVFGSLSSNSTILQVIFFSLLFGFFITKLKGPGGDLLKQLFEAGFEVMMKMAEFILKFIPIAVVALIARVVGKTGLDVFADLLVFMGCVVLAIAVHFCITLPLILRFVGGISPLAWLKAMWPALITAFSTSSSSATLPVTMRTVKEGGRASNKVSSFCLPLGATINMDGTALYECMGVIFLAQYYSVESGFELTMMTQLIVVITALLASVGAAGIPSAGLVMMLTILNALNLPTEAVILLLAVDRPLDMLRTATNVWSDTTCAAVVARSEGETDLVGALDAGGMPATASPADPPPDA
ncbi:MAG: cation:dicarboxylase symporter family transporter [Planctomycetota bacterium]|nr:cation:dicarboxylase symporter family transporter [Planctomycetota bacterium]